MYINLGLDLSGLRSFRLRTVTFPGLAAMISNSINCAESRNLYITRHVWLNTYNVGIFSKCGQVVQQQGAMWYPISTLCSNGYIIGCMYRAPWAMPFISKQYCPHESSAHSIHWHLYGNIYWGEWAYMCIWLHMK